MSDATPPHHPTYQVHLPEWAIREILTLVNPQRTIRNVQQLSRGQSFNNRIYFIAFDGTTEHVPFPVDNAVTSHDQVLKICGRFWGREKVQNEVSCLLLLEKYCPTVPAPRLLAYCDDTNTVHLISRHESDGQLDKVQAAPNSMTSATHRHPWILMTRCPGERLELSDLDGHHGDDILRQLAQHMAQWRLHMPQVSRIGNLRITDEHGDATVLTFPGLPSICVSGLVQNPRQGSTTPSTLLQYYSVLVQDQLRELETNKNYSQNRQVLVPQVHHVLEKVLPKLQMCLSEHQTSAFTHYDFSPRNISISRSETTGAPRVTGVMDFEFAGFFPVEEEFTNLTVHSPDDWPARAYTVFLGALEEFGASTPLRGMDPAAWNEARVLVTLIKYIAPWWLAEGGVSGDELKNELDHAADEVKTAIRELESTLLVGQGGSGEMSLTRNEI